MRPHRRGGAAPGRRTSNPSTAPPAKTRRTGAGWKTLSLHERREAGDELLRLIPYPRVGEPAFGVEHLGGVADEQAPTKERAGAEHAQHREPGGLRKASTARPGVAPASAIARPPNTRGMSEL